MIFDKITSKLADLILFVYYNGYITSTNQNIVKGTLFYITIWDLRDKGILRYVGFVNGKKAWTLTEKGKELAKILYMLRKRGFI